MEWIIRYRIRYPNGFSNGKVRKVYATCPYQPSKAQARAYVPIVDHGGVEIVSIQAAH